MVGSVRQNITQPGIKDKKKKDFVMAAKASGTSKFKIVINHVLLNSISPIIVYSTLRVAAVIMHIAKLFFYWTWHTTTGC